MTKNNKTKSRTALKTQAPVAYSNRTSFPIGKNRSRRIVNSELVGSVNVTTAFSKTQYALNPGIPETFPWLYETAQNFERYIFHKLCFRYVTRTATTTVGSILLSPEYDPEDVGPTSESEASNTQDAVADVTWKDLVCHLDVKSMMSGSPKFIRTSQPSGALSLYDAGNFYLCAVGGAGTAEVGKLWVDYDVELSIPQSSPEKSFGPSSIVLYKQTAAQVLAVGVPANILSDASPLVTSIIPSEKSGVLIAVPPGYWRCEFSCYATMLAGAAFTLQWRLNGVTVNQIVCNNGAAGTVNKPITFVGYGPIPIGPAANRTANVYCSDVSTANSTLEQIKFAMDPL